MEASRTFEVFEFCKVFSWLVLNGLALWHISSLLEQCLPVAMKLCFQYIITGMDLPADRDASLCNLSYTGDCCFGIFSHPSDAGVRAPVEKYQHPLHQESGDG